MKVAPAPGTKSRQTHLISGVPKLSRSSRGFSSLSIRKIFQREDVYDLKTVTEELSQVRSSERTDHSSHTQSNRYHKLKPWYYRIFQFPKVRRLSPLKFYRQAQDGDILLRRNTTTTMMIPLSTTVYHHLLSTLSGKYIPKNYTTEYWNEVSLVVVLPDESRTLVKYALSIDSVGITLVKLSTIITRAHQDHSPLGLRAVEVLNERVAQGYTLCLRRLGLAAKSGRLTWYNICDISSFADTPQIGTIMSRFLSRLQFIVYQHSHESIVEASRCYNLMNPQRDESIPRSLVIEKLEQLINANVGGSIMRGHFEKLLGHFSELQEQQNGAEEDKQDQEDAQQPVPTISLSEFMAAFAAVSCTDIPTECDVNAVASAEFVFAVWHTTGVCTEESAINDHYFLPQVFSSHGLEIGAVTTRIKPWVGLQKFMVASEVYMGDDIVLKIK